jgi:hypothetical protein
MNLRGLNDPLLVVSDGAPGIIKAIEVCFPRAMRQRCLVHRMRNLAVKVPEDQWPEFKAQAQAAYQAPSRAIARELAKGVVADYGNTLASAVTCFMDDFEACIAHLGTVWNLVRGAGRAASCPGRRRAPSRRLPSSRPSDAAEQSLAPLSRRLGNAVDEQTDGLRSLRNNTPRPKSVRRKHLVLVRIKMVP